MVVSRGTVVHEGVQADGMWSRERCYVDRAETPLCTNSMVFVVFMVFSALFLLSGV